MTRLGWALALAAILAATALVHGAEVARNLPRYHWEDWRFFRHTRENVHSPLDCFTQPSAWPGLYRPLTTNCYYLAGRALWGNRVAPYHVFNAGVYVLNALLLFAIARRLLPFPLAVAAAALWASRAAHRQVLLYTSEFQALGSTFFALLALALALPPRISRGARGNSTAREAAALAAFAAALLGKESMVALPAIVTAASWIFGARQWRRDLFWWGLAGAWALLFAFVFRGASGYAPTGFAYDVSARAATRFAAYALMMSNAVVLPIDDWTAPPRIPLLAAQPLVLGALAVAAGALLGLLVAARRLPAAGIAGPARTMALGLAWFLAGTAPFVVLEDRLFLRYFYFGSAGLALLLAAVPAAAGEWWRLRSQPPAAAAAASVPTPAPAPP